MSESRAPRQDTDAPQALADGSWHMWALAQEGRFTNPGHRRFAAAHAQPGQEPVAVCVRERGDGRYLGWIARGADHPTMIYPHETLFRVCFPYGPEAEEQRGRGRIVRLELEALERQ